MLSVSLVAARVLPRVSPGLRWIMDGMYEVHRYITYHYVVIYKSIMANRFVSTSAVNHFVGILMPMLGAACVVGAPLATQQLDKALYRYLRTSKNLS